MYMTAGLKFHCMNISMPQIVSQSFPSFLLSFSLQFEFTLNRVEDSWYLSGLQVANLTTDDNHLFDYGTCGDAISVPEELSYYCSKSRVVM